MNAVMDSIHAQLGQLRSKLDEIPALQRLEDQTNVPKEYLTAGASASLVIIIFFGLSAGTLCSIVGFLYPALKSFQAIEHRASTTTTSSSSSASSSGEVTQWLIYWVVYSFFAIIEVFIDALLYWIPFYYAFKVAFLLWAMLPQTRGAKFLYDNFLKDFLKSKESMIDRALRDAKSSTSKVMANDASVENVKKASGDESKKDE
ncbi:hypothetical protein ACHAWU_005645 [Discostella pseudostelligera]|uniref:Receptor expression-enhancing protein n=1 Tax=Discostella pseudostelligera TaxID=259834 RepID=A0ABD3M241_9STRA